MDIEPAQSRNKRRRLWFRGAAPIGGEIADDRRIGALKSPHAARWGSSAICPFGDPQARRLRRRDGAEQRTRLTDIRHIGARLGQILPVRCR
jgi:hypothetical protein